MSDPGLLAFLGDSTPSICRYGISINVQLQPDQTLKTVAGPAFTPLQPQGASVAASLLPLSSAPDTSQPGMTLNRYGQGRAIAYSFFLAGNTGIPRFILPIPPQALYTRIAAASVGTSRASTTVIPALLANTSKPVVVSHEVVEVCRLQSDQGIALVILNWTDEPIQTLTLEVPGVGRHTKITSVQGSTLSSQPIEPNTLRIQLSIQAVDVVLIE